MANRDCNRRIESWVGTGSDTMSGSTLIDRETINGGTFVGHLLPFAH
jgi:hypothetical protein